MFHLVMFPHVLLDMGKHLVLMVGCEAAVPTLYRSLGEITVPCTILYKPEAEFKEFEPRFKFKPWLKYGWFHLKLYSIFQGLSRLSIKTGFWQI